MDRAEQIIARLGMRPLAGEGGFFVETYRSADRVPAGALGSAYDGLRSMATAILYLLRAEDRSRLHRLAGDEVWHFYQGDPVELVLLPSAESGVEEREPADESGPQRVGDGAFDGGPFAGGAFDGRPFADSARTVVLGPDLAAGQRVQVVVPRGTWQGAQVLPGGRWALMGTTMAPGFEAADFELPGPAEAEALLERYPDWAEPIRRLL